MRENNAGQDLADLVLEEEEFAILNIEKGELVSGFLYWKVRLFFLTGYDQVIQ